MHFVKMQGLGNDFIVLSGEAHPEPTSVTRMCDRHLGIGADGLLTVSGEDGRVAMGYWNADGSAAEMCGNGLRCVARYAYDRGMVTSPEFVVETPVGERRVEILGTDMVSVEIGSIAVGDDVSAEGLTFTRVSVGNPHAVALVDDVDRVLVGEIGPRVETDPRFPHGSNVEFIALAGPGQVRMRVWERGVGETLACGTGMVAAAALARRHTGEDTVQVQVPGGIGSVTFRGETGWLTGPAMYVFDGEWPQEI